MGQTGSAVAACKEDTMSETPFFKTRMGQRFYEHTMPDLVKQLERLNELLELLLARPSGSGTAGDAGSSHAN